MKHRFARWKRTMCRSSWTRFCLFSPRAGVVLERAGLFASGMPGNPALLLPRIGLQKPLSWGEGNGCTRQVGGEVGLLTLFTRDLPRPENERGAGPRPQHIPLAPGAGSDLWPTALGGGSGDQNKGVPTSRGAEWRAGVPVPTLAPLLRQAAASMFWAAGWVWPGVEAGGNRG